jgi:hypothetical protein
MTDPQAKFVNRELSWLEFNQRVLDEARDVTNPLLERLKFLAITGSNLDEFFMVRVGSLKMLVSQGKNHPGPAGLTPAEQLAAIADAEPLTADELRELAQLKAPLGRRLTFGDRWPEIAHNLGRNLAERRIGAVQAMLADMAAGLLECRLLYRHAAELVDAGASAITEGSAAKLVGGRLATEVSSLGVQIHGGSGYIRDFEVERLYRDARLFSIGGGTSESAGTRVPCRTSSASLSRSIESEIAWRTRGSSNGSCVVSKPYR